MGFYHKHSIHIAIAVIIAATTPDMYNCSLIASNRNYGDLLFSKPFVPDDRV